MVDEGTASLAAYDAYLLGRFHWNKRTAADLELAAKFYNDAIAADSAYARAWAGLAETYLLFHAGEYEVVSIPWPEAARRGEAAARQALDLDSASVEAYTALAAFLEKQKRFAEAERMYQRAIDVDLQYPTAHQWYGGLLLSLGRLDEGLREFQTAMSLDPLSFVINLEVVESLDAVGRTDEATTLFNKLAAEYDGAQLLHYYGSMHFMVAGDIDRAAGHFERTYVVFGGDPVQGASLARRIRDPNSQRQTLLAIADTSKGAGPRIAIHRALSEDDQVLDVLERILLGPDTAHVYLPEVMMTLGPELSAHPRARAALRRFRGEGQ